MIAFKDIPWDYMPPEQHFNTPGELKKAILKYQEFRLVEWQKNPVYLERLGKFEAIANGDGSFTLWPCAVDYAFLFRGQQAFYKKCVPTLFRSEHTPDQLFLERLKIVEFELLAKQYPSVQFFEDKKIRIDYIGLAQHYLFKTEVLDLTSDIDVAMFFAMCDFDYENDCYHAKSEKREYIGYVYVYPFVQNILEDNRISFDRVRPIGLQPFKRPGEQCGYALYMNKKQSFKSSIYSFSYTPKDSKYILDYFQKERPLFFKDKFSNKAKEIEKSSIFSVDAVQLAAYRWSRLIYGRRRSATFCQDRMNYLNIHFKSDFLPWSLTTQEYSTEYEYFYHSELSDLLQKIIKLRTISEGVDLPYRTIDLFCDELLYKLMCGGCPSLPGYPSEYKRSYDDKTKVSSLEYDYSRAQTQPNPQTGKIDKWDNLSWEQYSRITIDSYNSKAQS